MTNKEVIERVGQKKMCLNEVLRREVNCIGNILQWNCLLNDVTGIQKKTMKGNSRRGK